MRAAEPPGAAAALEEVLVTGERPGPGMWRVSKRNHDLWILGMLEPLPKKMMWRSAAVDARIAVSQVVLAAPRVSADVGFFRGLTLLPSLLRARRSPDGQTLEQALPHDLYVRWLALRVKFLRSWSDDERMRPMLAALDLYTHALDASGLTSDESVWADVEQIARKHRVPIQPVTLNLKIDDPKAAIRELGQISRDAEIGCLETTIARLETELPPMRQRANLWSLGDIDGLRAMHYADEQSACLHAFFSVPQFRDQFFQAKEQLTDAWLAAADDALDRNESSFAVLPMTELLKPDGWLAKLRARGYTVVSPLAAMLGGAGHGGADGVNQRVDRPLVHVQTD
jgi:TraB/PrgY/gumN family